MSTNCTDNYNTETNPSTTVQKLTEKGFKETNTTGLRSNLPNKRGDHEPRGFLRPWKPFSPHPRATRIASEIDATPSEWTLTPLQGKSPKRKGWQTEEPLDRNFLKSLITDGEEAISQKTQKPYRRYYSGFGLRTGEVSGGVVAIDVDGDDAEKLLGEIAGRNLPQTVSWTSGKPGRRQLVYQVPREVQPQLVGFTRRAIREWDGVSSNHDLDFRYNGCQSALPPSHHPDTGSYGWIDSPADTEVATAPDWLCALLVKLANRERAADEAKRRARQDQFREPVKRQQFAVDGNGADLLGFYRNDVLPKLNPEQIYNWGGHNWHCTQEGMKGCPPWRESQSGQSFHVDFVDRQWCWFDFGSGEGGDAIKYRHMLAGGTGYPRGREWVEIVGQLAREVGLELPEWKPPARENSPAGDKTDSDVRAEIEKRKALIAENTRLNALTYEPDLVVNQRYLDESFYNHLRDRHGLIFVKSAKGSGKSRSLLKPLIAKWKSEGKRVLSISVRVILGLEQAAKFEITWIDSAGMSHTAVGLCWDSLLKFAEFEWDAIVIDEVRMGVKHLLTANTAIKEIRPQTLKAFRQLLVRTLGKGGTVIACDADLTDVEVDYFKALAPGANAYIAVNTHPGEGAKCDFYTGKRDEVGDELFAWVEDAVEAFRANPEDYRPCLVVADSQTEIKAIYNSLCQKYPELEPKFWRFDKETSETEDARRRIGDIDGAIATEKPLVLLYSPTMNIGVSIDDPWFQHRFGFYFGVLEPCEFRQSLARERNSLPTTLWATDSNHLLYANGSSDPEVVKKQAGQNHKDSIDAIDFAHQLAREESLCGADVAAYQEIFTGILNGSLENTHFETWAMICARANFGKKNCGELLKHELIKCEGWEIVERDGETSDYSGTIKLQKEEERRVRAIKLSIGAKDTGVDEDWARDVLNNPRANYDERIHAMGVTMRYRYPGLNFEADFIDEHFLADRNWSSQQWTGWLLDHPEISADIDYKSNLSHLGNIHNGGEPFLPNVKTIMATVRMLQQLGVRELISSDEPITTHSPIVREIFERAVSMPARVKATTGIAVSKSTKPIRFARSLVEKVGLKLKQVARRDKERIYQISGRDDTARLSYRLSLDLKFEDKLSEGLDIYKGESCRLDEREALESLEASQRKPDIDSDNNTRSYILAAMSGGDHRSPIAEDENFPQLSKKDVDALTEWILSSLSFEEYTARSQQLVSRSGTRALLKVKAQLPMEFIDNLMMRVRSMRCSKSTEIAQSILGGTKKR